MRTAVVLRCLAVLAFALCVSCSSVEKKLESEIDAQLKSGQRDLAFATLDAYIKAHPEAVFARELKIKKLFAVDDVYGALAEFDELADSTPGSDVDLLRRLYHEKFPQGVMLYTDSCDPRVSKNYCQITSNFSELAPFFDAVESSGRALVFRIPKDPAEYLLYDFVILDTCSNLYRQDYLDNFHALVKQGLKALILGDNSCVVGEVHAPSSLIASRISKPMGFWFGGHDPTDIREISIKSDHPYLKDVTRLNAWRVAPIISNGEIKALVSRPDGEVIFGAMRYGKGVAIAFGNAGIIYSETFPKVLANILACELKYGGLT